MKITLSGATFPFRCPMLVLQPLSWWSGDGVQRGRWSPLVGFDPSLLHELPYFSTKACGRGGCPDVPVEWDSSL